MKTAGLLGVTVVVAAVAKEARHVTDHSKGLPARDQEAIIAFLRSL